MNDVLRKAQMRREYVTEAKAAAVKLFISTGEPVTIDDVRAVCPPPEDIDGPVMGAVLRAPEWIKTGYVTSSRRSSRQRPLARFSWVGPA